MRLISRNKGQGEERRRIDKGEREAGVKDGERRRGREKEKGKEENTKKEEKKRRRKEGKGKGRLGREEVITR